MNSLNVRLFPRVKYRQVPQIAVWVWLLVSVGRISGQDDRVHQLIANFSDKDARVQQSAVIELGKIGTPAIEPLLAVLRQRNENDKLSSTERRWVEDNAERALGAIGEPAVEPLLSIMRHDIKDPGYSGVVEAARALGYIKDPRAVEPLLAAIRDPDHDVQWGAANALGNFKDARSVGPLIDALKNSGYVNLQESAIKALGEIKDARAIEPLIETLKGERLRNGAANSLRNFGTPAVEPLITALKDPDSSVRLGAAKALGGIKDSRVVAVLTTGLRAHDTAVIVGAHSFFADQFNQNKDSSIEDALIEALNTQVGPGEGSEMARDLLNGHGSKLRDAASQWLTKNGYRIIGL